jgi:hypothetical protein
MSSNEYQSELDKAKQINTIDVDLNYHPMSVSVYPANWSGGSEFEKYKMTEFNRQNNDLCYNQRKDFDNAKKMKYMTWNGVDLLKARENYNFFGISVQDHLTVPGEKIDNWSELLNGKNGGELTNCNTKYGFGQLPYPTTPYSGQIAHGDVITEDKIRNNIEVKKRSCLPIDKNFYTRSFTIFDDKLNIETPQALKSVEMPSNGFELGRNGISTRFTNKYKK